MDDNDLIDEIKKYRSIYDRHSLNYRSKRKRDEAWERISATLNIDESICQTRWRSIRDRYARECMKMQRAVDCGEAPHEPTWSLYHCLEFLKSSIKHRNSTPQSRAKRIAFSPTIENTTDETNMGFVKSDPIDVPMYEEEETQLEPSPPHSAQYVEHVAYETEPSRVNEDAATLTQTQLLSLVENIHTIAERVVQLSESQTTNSNDTFLKLLSLKLSELSEEQQEDTKMFFLNYVHKKIKEKKVHEQNTQQNQKTYSVTPKSERWSAR